MKGSLTVNKALFPLYVPTVKLLVEAWLDAAGAEEVQLLTEICGRPPANACVMPILIVCASAV
jgi:hypothetical protein